MDAVIIEPTKVIHVEDVRDVRATQVRPGDVIAEGIVLSVEHAPQYRCYFLHLPRAQVVTVDSNGSVQVYARVSSEVLDALREAFGLDA